MGRGSAGGQEVTARCPVTRAQQVRQLVALGLKSRIQTSLTGPRDPADTEVSVAAGLGVDGGFRKAGPQPRQEGFPALTTPR